MPATANASSHAKSLSDLGTNEVMFAQMMIPHHKQAIDISALAKRNSSNATIRSLASGINAAQRKEIAQMRYWLAVKKTSSATNMVMEIDGMLSTSQLKNLKTLKSKKFDRAFLSAMIAHHKGALQMLPLLKSSTNQEARNLEQAIYKAQSKEITLMQRLLRKLG